MKNVLVAGAVAVVVCAAFFALAPKESRLGVALTEPSFNETGVTNTQVSCNTTTTLIVASSTDYSSFQVANVGAGTVYLCRAASLCSATSGIPIYGSSTGAVDRYIQADGYRGTWRCAATAVTNINVSYSH